MNFIKLLYGFLWSFISRFPFEIRTLLFIAIFFILFYYPISKIVPIFLNFVCFLTKLVIRVFYKAVYFIISLIMIGYKNKIMNTIYNKICEICDILYKKLKELQTNYFSKKALQGKHMLILYILIVVVILLPCYVEFKSNFLWIPSLSEKYAKFESDSILKSMETVASFHRSMEEQKKENTSVPEIWISLSERGINGTNVRAEPNANSEKIDVISGEDKVLYLNDQDGLKNEGWIYVRLENGLEGWIRGYLLEPIP